MIQNYTSPRAPRMTCVYLSVRYIASGPGHLDRLPCMIRLKHKDTATNKVILIDWGTRMISPLTSLTGLDGETIRTHGTTFENAVATVRAELTPETVIVGMNMKRHVHALHLCRNVHYGRYVDLTSLLKVKIGHRLHFLPLEVIATVLGYEPNETDANSDLEMVQHVDTHCPTAAAISAVLGRLKEHLHTNPKSHVPGIYSIDGVCTSAYNERRCSCQQMTLGPLPLSHPTAQPRPRSPDRAAPTRIGRVNMGRATFSPGRPLATL